MKMADGQDEQSQREAFMAGFGAGSNETAASVEIVNDLDENGNVFRSRIRIGGEDWTEWQYVETEEAPE